jgi:hypothetical protein
VRQRAKVRKRMVLGRRRLAHCRSASFSQMTYGKNSISREGLTTTRHSLRPNPRLSGPGSNAFSSRSAQSALRAVADAIQPSTHLLLVTVDPAHQAMHLECGGCPPSHMPRRLVGTTIANSLHFAHRSHPFNETLFGDGKAKRQRIGVAPRSMLI